VTTASTAACSTASREIGAKLLEVYLPVHTPNGTPLLFEAYYRYNAVQANGTRLWRSFAPISLGSLVMLEHQYRRDR